MNLRWLWLNLVPPEVALTSQQRTELRRIIQENDREHARLQPSMFAARILLGLIAFLAFTIGELWILFLGGQYLGAHAVWVFFLWCMLWWAIIAALSAKWTRRRTFAALHDMGYELCSACGYWLRDLTDDVKRCPECGAAREPMPHTPMQVQS